MMLAGHLVNAAFRLRIRDKHAGFGESRWSPDVEESSAAVVANPQAWILAIPPAIWIRIRGMVRVVRVFPRAIGLRGAVAAKESNIIHQRIRSCSPKCGDSTGICAARIQANADHDIAAATGCFEESFWAVRVLECRRIVR